MYNYREMCMFCDNFFHPPNETNLTLQGSVNECGNVQLVKTRELNVITSLGRNLTLGNCRQDFTVLWLYQWFPTNLKQSMHKMLTLGPLSLPLARDANVYPMVPSLHPDLHIHNYCWVFNYCLYLKWQAGMLLWWFYLFLPGNWIHMICVCVKGVSFIASLHLSVICLFE